MREELRVLGAPAAPVLAAVWQGGDQSPPRQTLQGPILSGRAAHDTETFPQEVVFFQNFFMFCLEHV